MSQAGMIGLINTVPSDVAITYVANTGTATAAAHVLNVLGTDGATTTGSGNTITIFPAMQIIKGPIVDLKTAATTTIFTPTSNFVITGIIFYATSKVNPAASAGVNIGFTGPNFDDIIAGSNAGASNQNQYSGFSFNSDISNVSPIPAATPLNIKVVTPSGATTDLEQIYIVGFFL